MYAIIEDSGKQFCVSEGDTLEVDLRELAEDAKEISFDRVLLVGGGEKPVVGVPLVAGAKVTAEVLDAEFKGDKTWHYYWHRRKASRRKTGHRQKYMQVRITKIVA